MTETNSDGLTLGQLRSELAHLVALADTAERPKPDAINPPGHGMAGHEWRVAQEVVPGAQPPLWVVRTVDDPETRDSVYIAQPDHYQRYDWERDLNFFPLSPLEARQLAMALLAAADRADHLVRGVPRLEDHRKETA